jgi:hypothetical protein
VNAQFCSCPGHVQKLRVRAVFKQVRIEEAVKAVVTRYIFFEGLNILISSFCVCADGFLGLSRAFPFPIHLFTFDLLL